jgi:hypothetical protein
MNSQNFGFSLTVDDRSAFYSRYVHTLRHPYPGEFVFG